MQLLHVSLGRRVARVSLDPTTLWMHSLEQVIDAFWAVCFFIFKTTEVEYYVNASTVMRT